MKFRSKSKQKIIKNESNNKSEIIINLLCFILIILFLFSAEFDLRFLIGSESMILIILGRRIECIFVFIGL